MSKVNVTKLHTLTGHKDCIYSLERGKNKSEFFSAGGDGMVVLWDLNEPENGRLIARLPNSIYAMSYFEKANFLIVGQNFEGIHLIGLESRKEVGSLKISKSAIFDIQLLGDYAYLVTGDGGLFSVDLNNLSIVKKAFASEKSARSIAINPLNNDLAVGYSDHSVRIFKADTLELVKEIRSHKNSVFTLTYSPDYRFLLSGSRDAHIKVWDVEQDYEPSQSIVAHMYAINNLVYSPNGKYFASCSMDKSVKVWDAEQFKLLKVIDRARHAGHGTSVNKLLWTSYENQLISASDDRSISIWDIDFKPN
ncbi:WD40 repeat domain-containing protein [Xanthovirga aplysinae]|uniref:WD40 repeat domain-containing protein n=1 Tax=Xanthovirga aplysinae TaxID=2529853 RepID=UPI0012BD78A9|nr:WD40 repeat domain-containing protein [Xanthovirga aplysinae]MTI33365.1 WD40 repeat domain-containing protein [Xanthovirga aplysinae]